MSERRARQRRRNDEQVSAERRDAERRAGKDRRHDHRVDIEIWVEELTDDAAYLRCSANLSEGGVFFDHAVPHAVGTRLRLRFKLPGELDPVVGWGEVVSAGASGAEGVHFTEFEDDGQARVSNFIRRRR